MGKKWSKGFTDYLNNTTVMLYSTADEQKHVISYIDYLEFICDLDKACVKLAWDMYYHNLRSVEWYDGGNTSSITRLTEKEAEKILNELIN